MPLSNEAIQIILGIKKDAPLTPEDMAKNLKVTYYPIDNENLSNEIKDFAKKLEITLKELGVKIIPYKQCLARPTPKKILKRLILFFKITIKIASEHKSSLKDIPFGRFTSFIFGKRIKSGISVITLGSGLNENLPMDKTSSFKYNPIITILDKNPKIGPKSSFLDHMNEALNLFSWNMTNLVVAIDKEYWTVYSFNLSHPTYKIKSQFKKHVLESLITKIAAPVVPPNFSDFILRENEFNPKEKKYETVIQDLVDSGPLFAKTGLYLTGKKIDELNFRSFYYRIIGGLYLDDRNGMSYGFMARQMPTQLNIPMPIESFQSKEVFNGKDFCFIDNNLYLKIKIANQELVLKVPEISVITSRSGSNKTNLNPESDIIKMSLANGKMYLDIPIGLKDYYNYKPSFDTKVILAHAVGNAIFASILKYLDSNNKFASQLENNGLALAHWHGYIHPQMIPEGWYIHGIDNPSVSCSASQAAIYALKGKELVIENALKNKELFMGDIHIEPHHGTNMTYSSLLRLANILASNKEMSTLGNKYFDLYK